MALLTISQIGNPVLRAIASPVADPTAPEIARLAADMIDTMLDAPGVGLAAPQVGESLRMIVYRVPAARSGGVEIPPTVLINPVIEALTDETESGLEGCLSVPALRGLVPRVTRIRVSGVGLDGAPISRIAEGFHARVVQHECDHLDGHLYLDRVTDTRLLATLEESHHLTDALTRAGDPS
ncbi:peptide deformylase [Azospirillum griseum]|uniref:Peptide deformylase n=1 Tax=Azospirillum griseum TaxID=2496639 RepID=A0A431VD35_9PROT|nr:peptide deformylase [Azospirillum griseum]RTR16609.1 peptide deformylase [Azospirillum griseum]